MTISEQVKELRRYVEAYEKQPFGREVEGTVKVLSDAADTIESLSVKLQAAREKQNQITKENICETVKEICRRENEDFLLILSGKSCWSISHDEHIRNVAKFHKENEPEIKTKLQAANMERSAEDCGGWIPCSERLPEEEGTYLVTRPNFGNWITDTMYFCRGSFTDKYVKAWQPLPEPYHEP